MLGSGSNNLEDTQEFLAQLEACQDEMDAALSRSEFSAVIDLNETRISILASGVASNFKASHEELLYHYLSDLTQFE